MVFVDPRKTPFIDPRPGSHLPHLYKAGGCYFVTFRLRDAVSSRLRSNPDATQLDAVVLAVNDEPPLTLGSCVLQQPEVARIVQGAILASDGTRYQLAAWCIIPNHVHAVLTPLMEISLSLIMQSWKGSSSRRINLHLNRTGPLWQRESFDHLIRSVDSFQQLVTYTEMNPVAAGLCSRPEDWTFGSAHITRKG